MNKWLSDTIGWFTGATKGSPTLDQCAQTAHFFAGSFFIFAAQTLFDKAWIGWLAMVAFTTWKEAIRDPAAEGDPYLWDGAKDQAFYVLGALLAVGVLKA